MNNKDSIFAPFMSTNHSLSVGLNPLGMRTASEQLFTTLLPGMNVVTLRVRYYSFYCWLLKCFYEGRDNANIADFRRHIRMSEFLMALIHAKNNDGLGIPGITVATEMVKEGGESFNIATGATPNGNNSGGYWKGSMGAMGTYYVASLQEMRLIAPIVDNPHLFNITNTSEYICGKKLADVFEKSIEQDCSNLFKECVKRGCVKSEELDKLYSGFKSHNMKPNEERNLLIEMLLQNDIPSMNSSTSMRKETIYLLLKYLNECDVQTISELEYARFVYQQFKNPGIDKAAAVGWYAYYLNDSRQFESLNIFVELLKRLIDSTTPGGWVKIDIFTRKLSEEVCKELDIQNKKLEEVINDWHSLKMPKNIMAKAFYQILDDYVQNKDNYKVNKKLLKENFYSVYNDAIDSFEFLERKFPMDFQDYIKTYLTDQIIYNHYIEAMRKYSQNGIPTQKIAIENGYVRWLGEYSSSHSSPRINTLYNFMLDLGLVDNFKITEDGIEILKRIKND